MDKFRISYKCHTKPNGTTELDGFHVNQSYVGRSYNGLFEVAPNWGRNDDRKVITKRIFDDYFELLTDKELQN